MGERQKLLVFKEKLITRLPRFIIGIGLELLSIFFIYLLIFEDMMIDFKLLFYLTFFVLMGLFVIITFFDNISIDDTNITVRTFFVRKTYPLKNIVVIRKTRRLFFRNILITFDDTKSLYFSSLKNEQAFFEHMQKYGFKKNSNNTLILFKEENPDSIFPLE